MRPIPGEKHSTDESIDWTKAMIQPCYDQAYRCPRYGPIAASGDGAEGPENSESRGQATVAALLQHILQRGRAFFLWKGVPFSDAEELESKLAVKILDQLSKGNLPGNAIAWSKKIQGTIFMDYLRAKYREKNRLGQRQDADVLANVHDAAHDHDARLRELIEEIPADSRDVVERLIDGQEWAAIAAHHQKTVDELKEAVRSIEWPEGSGLLRRRRRRRPS
jgi:DNA-directed RNA polymerase specialized sigma24 family protein